MYNYINSKIKFIFKLNLGIKMVNQNMDCYDDFVEIHKVTNFKNLLDIITINDKQDLRENFIFRGIKNIEYDLIPSAFRHDDEKDNKKINNYISDSEFQFYLNKQLTIFDLNGDEKTGFLYAPIDKDEKPILQKPKYTVRSEGELQFKREIYVLLKFLNYADKIGLKIPSNTSIRQQIHNCLDYSDNGEEMWPKPEFYEIISLAQHHNLPTRALDWSYDYKVALYFAVEDIIDNRDNDCVLWAFNYNVFEEKNMTPKNIDKKEGLIIYRPEYDVNPNLKAQKGLFTFWRIKDYVNMDDDTSFDRIVMNNIIRMKSKDSDTIKFHLNGTLYEIEPDEKIFHKFEISGKLKAKILKELYLDGYGYENIYPDYYGVVKAIETNVKLERIIKQEKD